MQELVQLLPKVHYDIFYTHGYLYAKFFPHKRVQETATNRKSPAQTILKGINQLTENGSPNIQFRRTMDSTYQL